MSRERDTGTSDPTDWPAVPRQAVVPWAGGFPQWSPGRAHRGCNLSERSRRSEHGLVSHGVFLWKMLAWRVLAFLTLAADGTGTP